jgi:hypothetical protein
VSISGTIPVSGTVTVNQGTSPWVTSLASTTITGSVAVTGAFFQAIQPVSIAGTVAVTQSTSPWIVAGGGTAGSPGTAVLTVQGIAGGTAIPISGTVTVTPSGLQNVNLTQLNSVALGSPSNYGTSPGGVEVQGVNAFVTNTVATTLASTTITGTVAVTQSTSPWVVSGTVTTTPSGLQNVNLTQLDSTALGAPSAYGTSPGNVIVPGVNAFITNNPAENLFEVAGVILGASAVTNFGTAPAAANVPGVNASLFAGTTALSTTAGGLNVNLISTTITGTVTVAGNKGNNNSIPGTNNLGVVPGIANAATQTWTEGDQVLESMDLSGRQRVRGTLTPNNAAPDADGLMTLTHLANAVAPSYTEGNLVLASCDLAGNTRIIGTKTNNSAPPSSTQVGVIPAIANAAAPTWTEGDQVLLSEDLSGNLRVTLAGSATTPFNLTQVAGTALGATAVTAFGTAPAAANVPGVNSSLFAGTTGITATGTSLNVNLTNSLSIAGALTNNNAAPTATLLGVLPAIAETTYATVTYTTGDMVLPVTDLHGALNTDLQAVAGTGVSISAAGMQKVGIAGGANGTTIDASIAAGTAPGNGLAILSVYNNTPPSLTTGQSVALQCDQNGSIFVKNTRRSETKALSTTISTTTATAIVTAPGAGLFADLSSLIITVTPQGVTGEAFTVTVSDGTNSFIYDMFTGVTATLAPTQINASFNPPIPATTANTAWTATVSTITTQPVIHVTTLVILQKAS